MLYNRAYFACLLFADSSLSAKDTKIGPLENLPLYWYYACIEHWFYVDLYCSLRIIIIILFSHYWAFPLILMSVHCSPLLMISNSQRLILRRVFNKLGNFIASMQEGNIIHDWWLIIVHNIISLVSWGNNGCFILIMAVYAVGLIMSRG
jgi:hypothetical protein